MIEARTAGESETQTTGTKPEKITTSMIIADLENGIDRTGIQTKYHLESWEVKQMFQHPALKGKKAKKVRKLSFEFVDDSTSEEVDPRQMSIPMPDGSTIDELDAAEPGIEASINVDDSNDTNQLEF